MATRFPTRHTVRTRACWKATLLLLVLPLVLSLLLGLLASWVTPAWADSWVIECVDCPKFLDQMTAHSLQLDAEGHPRIAYGGDRLYYAWYDGARWQYETVPTNDTGWVGVYATLALDENGYAHIGYQTARFQLGYAYQDAGGWHAEAIPISELWSAHLADLVLDGDGNPYVVYYEQWYKSGPNLQYAYRDATGWHVETVDTCPCTHPDQSASLAVDAKGVPHLAYCSGAEPEGGLRYAYRDATGWHAEMVEAALVAYISLALDRDGQPHIGYSRHSGLNHAYRDEGGWHVETVRGKEGDRVHATSLSLDVNGYPHVSYLATTNILEEFDLEYAYQDTAGWHVEPVETGMRGGGRAQYGSPAGGGGTMSSATSLALDGKGYPHIGYYSGFPTGDLRCARRGAAGWRIDTVDRGSWLVMGPAALAVDRADRPNLVYADVGSTLHYASRDASGWQARIIPIGCKSPLGLPPSLALDGGSYPHLICSGRSPENLIKHAWQDADGWHVEVIPLDNTQNAGPPTALALDKDGYVHVIYHTFLLTPTLGYAYQDDTGWHSEPILSDVRDDINFAIALVLDERGYPHISYQDQPMDLKYGYRDGAGWHIEPVDTGGEQVASSSCPLVLDGAGYAHIAYFGQDLSSPEVALHHAYQDADGWHIETIPSKPAPSFNGSLSPNRMGSPALALDRKGYPHFSYYEVSAEGTYYNLVYTYKDAAGWHSQPLPSGHKGGSYGMSSLALDRRGHLHIGYYDAATGDVMYAHFSRRFPARWPHPCWNHRCRKTARNLY